MHRPFLSELSYIQRIILYIIIFSFLHVSTPWCFTMIKPDDVSKKINEFVILDARPKNIWVGGHIPGALSFSWENYTKVDERGIPYRILPPLSMAKQLGAIGISEKSDILVYGDADTSWGGEGWVIWLFSYLGHKGRIYLLDGGTSAWNKNKLPWVKQDSIKSKKVTTYNFQINNRIFISTEDLAKGLSGYQIVDTRSFFERIKGSIKGSVHIPWTDFYSGDDRKPVDAKILKKQLIEHGIDPAKPVVYYCTGGIRSAYAWAVHQHSGLGPALNYEEGMEAWSGKK